MHGVITPDKMGVMTQKNIYRVGGPTHRQWMKDMSAVDRIIVESDALVTDPDGGWVGVDSTKLPTGPIGGLSVAEHYSNLVSLGYWHGWIAA